MSKRLEDALRVLQGAAVVAGQAAASSRLAKRAVKDDLQALAEVLSSALRATAASALSAGRAAAREQSPPSSAASAATATTSQPSAYTRVLQGTVSSTPTQLLFTTHCLPIDQTFASQRNPSLDEAPSSTVKTSASTQSPASASAVSAVASTPPPASINTPPPAAPEPSPTAAPLERLASADAAAAVSQTQRAVPEPAAAARAEPLIEPGPDPLPAASAESQRDSTAPPPNQSGPAAAQDIQRLAQDVQKAEQQQKGAQAPQVATQPVDESLRELASSDARTTPESEIKAEAGAPMVGTPDSVDAAIQAASRMPKRKFRERAVPSSQFSRAMGFASLGAGLAWGAASDAVTRTLGPAGGQKGMLSEGNASRLANALCRMRGAALKIGQMLSIQDEDMMPPQVAAALEKVRQNADVMPRRQLESVLIQELGQDWHTRFKTFDWEPTAAASIGQVHQGHLHNGRLVAVKIQYPGVADSINSDVDNLMRLLSILNVFPKGLYIEQAVAVAKQELALECDYTYEASAQQRYTRLLQSDAELSKDFRAAEIVPELCTERVLCSTWVPGVAIDQIKDMNQGIRDHVGSALLKLTLRELYVWRFMQTDPNWGNFLYDEESGKICLIDFGAAREFPKPFVDDYLRMVKACADETPEEIVTRSIRLGFLTGEESDVMMDAHVKAGTAVGTPFATHGVYDFGSHNQLTKRVSALGATMLQHRLTAPPVEAYSLHRRLSGAFLANIKLRARVRCRELLMQIYDSYEFSDTSSSVDERSQLIV